MEEAMPQAGQRAHARIGAVLFFDVVGVAKPRRVDERDRDVRLRTFMAHVLGSVLPRHGGDLIVNRGDGLVAVFATAHAAASATFEMLAHPALQSAEGFGTPMLARGGVHCGALSAGMNRWPGDTLIVAARIAGQASPDQLLVSDVACAELAGSDAWLCTDLGYRHLKQLDSPVRLFSVLPACGGPPAHALHGNTR